MASPWPKYKTPQELEKKLEEYFAHCEEKKEFPNIAGMTYFCGFAQRSSWTDYENKGEKYVHVIKRAKTRCYDQKFQLAAQGKMDKTIFIFDAVNNHDMFNNRSDNRNEHSGVDGGPIKQDVTVIFVDPTEDK